MVRKEQTYYTVVTWWIRGKEQNFRVFQIMEGPPYVMAAVDKIGTKFDPYIS